MAKGSPFSLKKKKKTDKYLFTPPSYDNILFIY